MIEYQIPFLPAQQRINEDFVQLTLDIMRIKAKLYERRVEYKNRSKLEVVQERKIKELITDVVDADIKKVITDSL